MAKVIGVLMINLNPGVGEEEFIRFFNDQYAELGARMGWKGTVLKGDRGEREGKLVVFWEIPSQEQRDRYVLPGPILTAEGTEVLEPDFSRLSETWSKLVASDEFTDYVLQD